MSLAMSSKCRPVVGSSNMNSVPFFARLCRLAVARFGGSSQKTRELEPLRFAAREGGHGLAQLHVFQTHVDDGLQGADDFAVVSEEMGGFADGEIEHVGDVEEARALARVGS